MAKKTDIQHDAKGQFAKSQGDRKNNGLVSATPRAVTGRDDATIENADKKPSPNPGFDIRDQTNKRN
ncbi:hypothetical protein IHQ71_04405 [Rhizobium sp. TH2]|uniref:hypothetical protein n=1 Tax=Rhizobium sp. TH2 TaxID=2775403 RepID=UPI002157740A|nr:hypothetical protein [Rhizobium sp. TH2]UVC09861.1 hypothetical protein IHQ71_04405 [Rhizobium sp. TH2]